jgi:acetylornithine/N-succinyldiaminopimelate aminotransferase
VLEVIQREKLADNARNTGERLKSGLQQLAQKFPSVIQQVRGLGMMLGFELAPSLPKLAGDSSKPVAARFVQQLQAAGLLVVPAGAQVLRLLPPLNLLPAEAEEALGILESAVARVA